MDNRSFKYDIALSFASEDRSIANHGSFIPYDPALASHLARLHSAEKKRLEYNFLCLEESEDINIKQNIAAYLLHEKYGHGFFYSKTLLGRQLALLEEYGILDGSGGQYQFYMEAAQLIDDSSIIVNEGFATWMETAFLSKLDREVRQAVHPRYTFLVRDATGFYHTGSEFFRAFPPRYKSRYREGFEHLNFIEKAYNLRCAVQAFLIATQIDFGIIEISKGNIHFEFDVSGIKNRLLGRENPEWHSHVRLEKIADILYDHSTKVEPHVRKQYCYLDEHKKICPIKKLVNEKFKWEVR